MKVIDFSGIHRIFGDTLVVNDKLPVGTYDVIFNPQSGYALEKRKDMNVPEKLYGEHSKLADNMIRRYDSLDKNFGVILGGRKGTGKTMMARLISSKLRDKGIPTIIVSANTPNLPAFLQSIEQEVFVLFDEFEKVFEKGYSDNQGEFDEQTQFLPLFDGLSNSKHFYMITINSYYKLNQYFLGRPGRFHYNIQFDEISVSEIKEILIDNLTVDIENVDKLANLLFNFNVNYDQLMAIIDELNFGSKIEFIIKYMNLELFDEDTDKAYNIKLRHKNGDVLHISTPISGIEPYVGLGNGLGRYFKTTTIAVKDERGIPNHYYEFRLTVPTEAFSMDYKGNYDIDVSKIKITNDEEVTNDNEMVNETTRRVNITTSDIVAISVEPKIVIDNYHLPTF